MKEFFENLLDWADEHARQIIFIVAVIGLAILVFLKPGAAIEVSTSSNLNTDEVYEVEAEITHLDHLIIGKSHNINFYTISVRNVSTGFGATFEILGGEYAKYTVGDSVTVRVNGTNCDLVEKGE